MSRNHRSSACPKQQGSMLVIAIFIIVVISLLVASLSRILSSTADSVANEVYSAKAYYAADSGMEYGIYQVLNGVTTCASFPAITVISDVYNLNFDISGVLGLENCEVEITCQNINTGNSTQSYLLSKGTCDGGKIVAEHKVEAEVNF